MKTIQEIISENIISALGHELKIGDLVEFESGGTTIIGEIIDISEKEKVIVKPTGFRCQSKEEINDIKSKLKPKYTVNPKRCYLQVKI